MAYQNFFAAKLKNDIGSSDTSIELDTAPSATSGRMVLEARNPTQREIVKYTGLAGTTITGVTRGQGGTTAKPHTKNSLVEMNMTAEDLQELYDAFGSFAATNNDWRNVVSTLSVASGYNKGNRESVLDSTADLSNILSPGMRFQVARSVAPPTQCADFERDNSQYAARSTTINGITFTDDFTIEAWIKLESYPTFSPILSRYNGTSGFELTVQADGRLYIIGFNGGSGNYKQNISAQSVPTGRWVHVAATLDMSSFTSATNKVFIDGVEVVSDLNSSGTNPTSLVQAGNLAVGASNSLNPFDGKISDARLWGTIRTGTQIRDNMNQNVSSSSPNLLGNWLLNGNFNDATTNVNHLTAQGGVVATDTDNPMKATEYGIITKVTSTQITVFTGTEYSIPNQTLNSPKYSTVRAPYGFPAEANKWTVEAWIGANYSRGVGSVSIFYITPHDLMVPTGAWELGYQAVFLAGGTSGAAAARGGLTLTKQTSDFNMSAIRPEELELTAMTYFYTSTNSSIVSGCQVNRSRYAKEDSQIRYRLAGYVAEAAGSYVFQLGNIPSFNSITKLYAKCAYL